MYFFNRSNCSRRHLPRKVDNTDDRGLGIHPLPPGLVQIVQIVQMVQIVQCTTKMLNFSTCPVTERRKTLEPPVNIFPSVCFQRKFYPQKICFQRKFSPQKMRTALKSSVHSELGGTDSFWFAVAWQVVNIIWQTTFFPLNWNSSLYVYLQEFKWLTSSLALVSPTNR